MSIAGKGKIRINDKYASALGFSSVDVTYVWHGIEGVVNLLVKGRHIIAVPLSSVDQEIRAIMPDGTLLKSNPLAVLAVCLLARKLPVARMEDKKYYIRPKFNAAEFGDFSEIKS